MYAHTQAARSCVVGHSHHISNCARLQNQLLLDGCHLSDSALATLIRAASGATVALPNPTPPSPQAKRTPRTPNTTRGGSPGASSPSSRRSWRRGSTSPQHLKRHNSRGAASVKSPSKVATPAPPVVEYETQGLVSLSIASNAASQLTVRALQPLLVKDCWCCRLLKSMQPHLLTHHHHPWYSHAHEH